MVSIYVLECEGGFYYVGKSNNIGKRVEDHFASTGSEWTKLHKPIKLLRVIPNCDDADEDKFTKIMMRKYGIEKVRGGTYCQVNIDFTPRKILSAE